MGWGGRQFFEKPENLCHEVLELHEFLKPIRSRKLATPKFRLPPGGGQDMLTCYNDFNHDLSGQKATKVATTKLQALAG
jgi:hypothetical protein